MIQTLVFWQWWIAALIFLAIEMLSPGFFFLSMAIAAAIVGGVLALFIDFSLLMQLALFSVLSICSLVIWKHYAAVIKPSDHPLLNQRGAQYIGRTFALIEAIENGQGKIKVDDSRWTVEGEDCPVGTRVKVIAVNGTIFKVEKLS